MRQCKLFGFLFMIMVATAPQALAETNCYSNAIIQGWLKQRDVAARNVIQQWARGAALEDIAPNIAVIFTNEVHIRCMCRNSLEFLDKHLIIPDKEYNLKVETLPALILKYLIGFDILSPYTQFPKGGR